MRFGRRSWRVQRQIVSSSLIPCGGADSRLCKQSRSSVAKASPRSKLLGEEEDGGLFPCYLGRSRSCLGLVLCPCTTAERRWKLS